MAKITKQEIEKCVIEKVKDEENIVIDAFKSKLIDVYNETIYNDYIFIKECDMKCAMDKAQKVIEEKININQGIIDLCKRYSEQCKYHKMTDVISELERTLKVLKEEIYY